MSSVQEIWNYLISVSENLGFFLHSPNWFKDKPLWKPNAQMRGKNDDKCIRARFNSRQQTNSDAKSALWTGKTWEGTQEVDCSNTCTIVLFSIHPVPSTVRMACWPDFGLCLLQTLLLNIVSSDHGLCSHNSLCRRYIIVLKIQWKKKAVNLALP